MVLRSLLLQAEFEVICEEAQLASKFAAMDQMAKEQGLTQHSPAEGWVQPVFTQCSGLGRRKCRAIVQMNMSYACRGPRVGSMPAHLVLTRRVLAKQREAEELAAILQKVPPML